MASFGPVQRPSVTTQASDASLPQKDSSMASPQKDHRYSFSFNFNFVCPLSIPSSPEAAAIRIVKNLVSFGIYYLLFVYLVLFIALIPKRKVSLCYLVGVREIVSLYLLLLGALPKSFLLNKISYKSFVLFLLCIIACILATVAMILTKAGLHLLITVVSTTPVILVHATLWREDLKFVTSEEEDSADAKEEMVSLILGDAAAADESTNSV